MSSKSARKDATPAINNTQHVQEPVKLRRSKRTTAASRIKLRDVFMGTDESTIPMSEVVARPCTERGHLLYQVPRTMMMTTPVVCCFTCPGTPLLCETCLSPWQQRSLVAGEGHCSNSRCAVVGVLLTCALVTDPKSKVKGCPEFRACPKCHSLIMHGCGCKYVTCSQCTHRFCYICLSDRGECNKNSELYWSLTCSKPTAGRQWFCMG